MEQKSELDQVDEIMLPGFRFHPTDEELVAFYLRRKVQQRPLSIELIKQLDIYKFDPWDLPKMATIGEKEWYFYCPRDRKYRNSNRPNRVTTAGFWKATGTDRPIYSSDGTKCIGLKKSLVFYRGRAAKGIKTDWMMHEFRLPTLAVSSPCKRPLDKELPPNDSWAICRIFKKSTIAHRAPPHMWAPSIVDRTIDSNYNFINFHTNIVDQPKEISTDIHTPPPSTNNISSHLRAGDHAIHDFQHPNQDHSTNMAFGSFKFAHVKSIPCSLPSRSISLPSLEFSNPTTTTACDLSQYHDPSVAKGTLNFVSYMLQMPLVPDNAPRAHHHADNNVSQDSHPDDCTEHHQQSPSPDTFLKKSCNVLGSIPMNGHISHSSSLPFQSNLYDVVKGVSSGPWDIPTSTIL